MKPDIDQIKKAGAQRGLQEQILERLDAIDRCVGRERMHGVCVCASPSTTLENMVSVLDALEDLQVLLKALADTEPEMMEREKQRSQVARELFDSVFGVFFAPVEKGTT